MNLLLNVLSETVNKNVEINEFDGLINEINSAFDKSIVIPKDVMNSFKLRKKLNDDIWTDDELNESVRLKLLKIGKDFIKDLELSSDVKILDILFTGSLANFNWSKFSDIDLHIVIDFKKVDSDDKIVKTLFDAKKNVWNKEHDITVYDYPVELYVQDKNESLAATAVFSVLKNKWLKKPNREEFKIPKKPLQDKVKIFIEKLKDINNEYKDKNYQSVIKKSDSLKTKIKRMRKSGLEQSGEYSLENIIFKVLRRTDFIEELNMLKSKAYDNLMSINEVKELPYNPKPEMRLHQQKTLSSYANIDNIKKVIIKIKNAESKSEVDEKYFNDPDDGNGYYQVEFRFDGGIKTKLIKASGDMEQNELKFKPSDIGTTKQYQNIALYCFVMAGKKVNDKYSYLESPAADASAKAMVIFKDEILSFYGEDKYVDDLAAKISYEKMSDKDKRKKEIKDLENKIGRKLTPSERDNYINLGVEPKKFFKPLITNKEKRLSRIELSNKVGRTISPREYDEYKITGQLK
jgi:predicted nucleotidyltransferase